MFVALGYAFSLYSIPTFVTMAAVILLGVLTLARERISAVSVSFFLITLAVGVWLFAQSWLYLAADERVALLWSKMAYLGIPFIAAATYQFTVIVLGIYQKYKIIVWASWTLAALFSLAAIRTDALFSSLYHYQWGYYANFSWLGLPFITYFGTLLGASMVHYWRKYRTAPRGVHRDRIRALMLAFAIGYLGSVDFVAAYGVPLYPFGYLAILGFVFAAARAIWVHRLVDITPAFAAKQIINTMTDALFVLDHEGIIRVANRAADKLFGIASRELVSKAAIAVIDEPLFSDPDRFLALVQAGRIMNYEINFRQWSGEARCLSLSASVARDTHNQPVATVCIVRDITERKKAEERVQQQNDYLAALHDTSLALMNRLDLAELLEVILQRSAALVGTPHGYIYVVEAEEQSLVMQAGVGLFSKSVGERLKRNEGLAGKVWQTARPVIISDYSTWTERVRGFSDVPFHAVVGFPLESASQVVGVLGLAHLETEQAFTSEEMDILIRFAQLASIALDNARLYGAAQKELAERRRAEMEVKKLNEDLEQRVMLRTEELQQANKELEAFSYSVSHDLRAPLRAVTGFSNVILEDYGEQLTTEGQRYLALIRDNATNMGQLIDDLLSFSRLGRQQMELQEVNMDQLVRSVFEEIELFNPGRNLQLEVRPLPTASADRAMVRQVLANLLSNAAKFTKEKEVGEIKIGCETGDGQQDGYNVYYIRDNGAGFDMRYAHKLFGVFQRLHSANEFEGTGVGLALVQRIVQRHSGRVWASGEVGRGATIYFTLPKSRGDKFDG